MAPKNPAKVKAGLASARARWGDGPPRIVRLADLDSDDRALVQALVAAVRSQRSQAQEAA